ncbi:hypothetical protein ACNKHL_08505 [Shigella flexneri]
MADEFCIILLIRRRKIAADRLNVSKNVCNISRRRKRLAFFRYLRDEENDMLNIYAYKASDERSYVNKQNKKQPFTITFVVVCL